MDDFIMELCVKLEGSKSIQLTDWKYSSERTRSY